MKQQLKKFSVAQLEQDLNSGLTRQDLADKYDMPKLQIIKLLNHAGLSSKRSKRITFEITDDLPEMITTKRPEKSTDEELSLKTEIRRIRGRELELEEALKTVRNKEQLLISITNKLMENIKKLQEVDVEIE